MNWLNLPLLEVSDLYLTKMLFLHNKGTSDAYKRKTQTTSSSNLELQQHSLNDSWSSLIKTAICGLFNATCNNEVLCRKRKHEK